ncbi:MAG: riboflavin synthase [Gemmatimonadota bacterium]
MFTGIIEVVGEVVAVAPLGEGRRVRIAAPWSRDLNLGESVAVDGCCLTAVEAGPTTFEVEAVRETMRRTIIGDYAPGRRVNLERAARLGDRLGGHLVHGHIDRVGTLRAMERQGENRYITIDLPASEDLGLIAPRGSIAVNGISLTVLDVSERAFSVSIIPHTWEATALRGAAAGDRVNVEYDMIARYIQRIMELR